MVTEAIVKGRETVGLPEAEADTPLEVGENEQLTRLLDDANVLSEHLERIIQEDKEGGPIRVTRDMREDEVITVLTIVSPATRNTDAERETVQTLKLIHRGQVARDTLRKLEYVRVADYRGGESNSSNFAIVSDGGVLVRDGNEDLKDYYEGTWLAMEVSRVLRLINQGLANVATTEDSASID